MNYRPRYFELSHLKLNVSFRNIPTSFSQIEHFRPNLKLEIGVHKTASFYVYCTNTYLVTLQVSEPSSKLYCMQEPLPLDARLLNLK